MFEQAPSRLTAISGLTGLRHLKKRAQFLRAARGTRAGGRLIALQATVSDGETAGVGFTVTKKVGNAPERSRIKRRLRAAAKACNTDFKDKHDYVLIGRRDVLNAPFSVLVTGLKRQIDRIHGNGQDAQKS